VAMAASLNLNTATRSRGSNNSIQFEGLTQLVNLLVRVREETIPTFIAC
jgi:hypothetical protein